MPSLSQQWYHKKRSPSVNNRGTASLLPCYKCSAKLSRHFTRDLSYQLWTLDKQVIVKLHFSSLLRQRVSVSALTSIWPSKRIKSTKSHLQIHLYLLQMTFISLEKSQDVWIKTTYPKWQMQNTANNLLIQRCLFWRGEEGPLPRDLLYSTHYSHQIYYYPSLYASWKG